MLLVPTCSELPTPDNGNAPECTKENKFEFESVCEFTCSAGHELDGESTLTCVTDEESGDKYAVKWDETQPTCPGASKTVELDSCES